MDQSAPKPNLEMPRPEHLAPRIDGGELVVPEPEKQSSVEAGELLKQASQAVSYATQDDSTLILADDQQQPVALPTTPASDSPAIADDVDVIEKEWVQKAKTIVSQTKDDPHKQSVELTKFKHDYMSKRYGKDIKLPNEQAA